MTTKKAEQLEISDEEVEQAASGALVLSPMRLIELAVTQKAGVAELDKLLDLQLRWEANEAKKAFVAALAEFKKNPPLIERNKTVSFANVEYKHATLDKVAEIVGKELSKYGLSFRWQTAQREGGWVAVTCILQHNQGHSEAVTLEAPADTSGAKNSVQAIGSTVTYLERYTLLAATGMATIDQDTDGVSQPTYGELGERLEWIGNCSNLAELEKVFKTAYKEASAAQDKQAMLRLIAAKDAKKRELS